MIIGQIKDTSELELKKAENIINVRLNIIIIMVIFKCYFPGELIALS